MNAVTLNRLVYLLRCGNQQQQQREMRKEGEENTRQEVYYKNEPKIDVCITKNIFNRFSSDCLPTR